jgi:hypothetical protein
MAELPAFARHGLKRASKRVAKTIPLPARYDELSQRDRVAVRLEYAERQDGRCYYCQCELDGPPRLDVQLLPIDWRNFPGGQAFLQHPLHLHHCHRTGLTIGVVHALCNAVLAEYHNE